MAAAILPAMAREVEMEAEIPLVTAAEVEMAVETEAEMVLHTSLLVITC